MTQDEIIRMARDCYIFPSKESDDNGTGLYATFEVYKADIDSLQRFAALVAANEREKRTQELMQLFLDPENQPTQFGTATLEHRETEVLAEREACAKVCEEVGQDKNYHGIAAAIRARSDK